MTMTDDHLRVINANNGMPTGASLNRKFATPLTERQLKIRAVNAPVAEALGPWDETLTRAQHAIERARTTASPHSLESRLGPAWDATYTEALEALDELHAKLRPALEEARRLAAELAAELAEEEQAAREAAEEERRRQDFEDAVKAEVDAAEAKRLQKIEDEARKRLATAGTTR